VRVNFDPASPENRQNIGQQDIGQPARLADTPARIFISYSRKDGAAAAEELREWLLSQGFSIWQDIIALEGGRDWWSQIENALRSKTLQHFVFIVTPGALASRDVRREIRLARQEAKTVSPIKCPHGFRHAGYK
jgi:hypothetical protein